MISFWVEERELSSLGVTIKGRKKNVRQKDMLGLIFIIRFTEPFSKKINKFGYSFLNFFLENFQKKNYDKTLENVFKFFS